MNHQGGQFGMPITPPTGSKLHAETHNERRRFGYRRLFILLRREGEASGNHATRFGLKDRRRSRIGWRISFLWALTPPLGRSGERVGSLAQDGEISPVAEHAASFAAGDFFNYAKSLQISKRRVNRGG